MHKVEKVYTPIGKGCELQSVKMADGIQINPSQEKME